MKRFFAVTLVVMALLLCAVGWRAVASRPAPQTHAVVIDGMKFLPNVIVVLPGDTVEFTNADVVPHTVTERGSRLFDSGMIAQKGTWKITTSQPGTVRYQCAYHPDMVGTIVVGSEPASKRLDQQAPVEICGGQ